MAKRQARNASRIVVKDTGGRARPCIAPGAVVYNHDHQLLFLRLDDQGQPAASPVKLDLDYASPGGLVRHEDGYFLAGGFSDLRLLDLNGTGAVRRELSIARSTVIDRAMVRCSGNEALLVWQDQDTKAVHSAIVDANQWKVNGTATVSAPDATAQWPAVGAMDGSWWIAWGESAGGPMVPRLARLLSATAISKPERLAAAAPGPAFPVGLLPGGSAPRVVVLRTLPSARLELVSAEGITNIADLQPMLFPEYSSADGGDWLALAIGQQQLTWWVRIARDGKVLFRAALSESRLRSRSPSVAVDEGRLWFAWEQFLEGDGGASVAVDVRSWR